MIQAAGYLGKYRVFTTRSEEDARAFATLFNAQRMITHTDGLIEIHL